MNRFFGGTFLPRLQLDLLPGLRCAAHFALLAHEPASDVDGYLAAGAAMQRFWLACTGLGLQLQPQYTPLVFADYARRLRKRVGRAERLELVERMWTAAFADGAIGEHEARLMHLAAELLAIPPAELAEASRRLQAQRGA